MSRAYTRAQLAAMRPDDLAAQADEINEWAAAGAVDGRPPPERPERLTVEQVAAMTPEQVAANLDAVNASLADGAAV